MWDGYLGQINTVTHVVESSSPEVRPIHYVPYRAGPKSREAEEAENDKMPAMKVIKPAKTEWALPIVFGPKKDGPL